ncbi:MAG: molecular chaperone DnaJ [Pseudomonadales bacterium]
MLIVLSTLLSVVAFVVLFRLLWLSGGPGRYSSMITIAAVILVMGLLVLIATGRLHWLAAVAAAAFPFMRRGLGLLPLFRSFLGGRQGPSGAAGGGGQQHRRSGFRSSNMSRSEALEILGLGSQPTREEILAAHRRLIQKLHPDRGGSNYLTQQLNEAKQRLLEDV